MAFEDSISQKTPFSDVGVNDISVGVALFQALRIDPARLAVDPQTTAKLQMIAGFLNDEPDPHFTISKIVGSNKGGDSHLERFVEFVGLETKRRNMEKELDELEDFINNAYG